MTGFPYPEMGDPVIVVPTGPAGPPGPAGSNAALKTRAPTNTDDNTQGYSAGQLWYNSATGFVYLSTSVATSAAVWAPILTPPYLLEAGGSMSGVLQLAGLKALSTEAPNGYQIAATDVIVVPESFAYSGATWTIPTTDTQVIILADPDRVVSSGQPVILSASSGTVNGDSTATALSSAGAIALLIGDGGGNWTVQQLGGAAAGALLAANNLSDVANSGTAKSNLGFSCTAFTVNGVYSFTVPAAAKFVQLVCIGAGSGGGSGRVGASGEASVGGGGGCSGAFSEMTYPAASLPSTLHIQVAAGGVGGVAQSSNSTNGNPGSSATAPAGGWSTGSVNAMTSVASAASSAGVVYCGALSGGAGGSTAGGGQAGGGGAGCTAYSNAPGNMALGLTGGSASATGGTGGSGTAQSTGAAQPTQPTGGGAGGGITTGNTPNAGGQGGGYFGFAGVTAGGTLTGFGGGGAATGAPGQAGYSPTSTAADGGFMAGQGGGGGGASTSANGGNGGAGGAPGGGGGGGGAARNGFSSGAGGAGADGAVYILCWG